MIEKVIKGDLLDAKEKFICQQCNCVTMLSHGLSAAIAKRYPWADVYAHRKRRTRNCTSEPSIPGTILIVECGDRGVINFMAQYFPGAHGYNQHGQHYSALGLTGSDNHGDRIGFFQQCLDKLDALNLVEAVAMPMYIGCGLAGGNWAVYSKMLEACTTRIVLYHL
jgi:O-acetyl-ADP-ribose deacetylase (regulator of RNase III)